MMALSSVAFCSSPLKLVMLQSIIFRTTHTHHQSSPRFQKSLTLFAAHSVFVATTDDLCSVSHLYCCRCGFLGKGASSCLQNLTTDKAMKHQQLIQVSTIFKGTFHSSMVTA